MILVNPNALFLLIVLLVISFILIAFLSNLHFKDEKEKDIITSQVRRKYIKPTPTLYNAVLEAYQQACEKEDEFEQKAYDRLMLEIKEKL